MTIPVLSSRIDSVTVHRRGAVVCRVAVVLAAQPVPPQVKLGNLPLSLEDASVRVRVEGEGGDLPVASDVRVVLDLAHPDSDLPPPDDAALKAARRRLAGLQQQLTQLGRQRQRLEQLTLYERPANKRGDPPRPSPVAARMAALEFRHAAISELDQQLDEIRAQERRAHHEVEDLEQRWQAASTARQARPHELRKAALITLRGRTIPTAPVRLVLEYRVPGACWAPAYAISLAKDLRQGVVSLRAVVAQRTGEDWRGVRLTLSTADAQRWYELPELQALRIGRRQATPLRRGWRAPPVGAIELYGDYDRFTRSPVAAPEPMNMLEADEDELDGSIPPSLGAYEDEGGEYQKERRSEPKPRPQVPRMALSMPPAPSAPPPPPAGAPMPAMASMMRNAPPPARSRVEPQAERAKRSGGPPVGGRGGGGASFGAGAVAEAPVELEHEASLDQLAYGDLRMYPPADRRRGRLVLSQRHERYVEMVAVRTLIRDMDVVGVIDTAVRQAEAVAHTGVPPRHQLATSQQGFDYIYVADGAVELPSDGAFHSIPLMARPTSVSLGHVVVPRESTDVFRQITLKNPLDAPLLPGPADVYLGGDYLLSTDLCLCPPQGEVSLGLGVEPAIKVARNTHFAEESAGLMGGSLLLRHEVKIEVANRRDVPVHVEVRDRLPHLREREDEIQLEVTEVSPKWSEFDPEEYSLKGGHRWNIEVPPGQQRLLRVVYVIKISAKKELVGGNRRES